MKHTVTFTAPRCHTAPLPRTCRERGASSGTHPTKETARMIRRRPHAAAPPRGLEAPNGHAREGAR